MPSIRISGASFRTNANDNQVFGNVVLAGSNCIGQAGTIQTKCWKTFLEKIRRQSALAGDYMPHATTTAVAIWILDQVRKNNLLTNRDAVNRIGTLFGTGFLSKTSNLEEFTVSKAVVRAVESISRNQVGFCRTNNLFTATDPAPS